METTGGGNAVTAWLRPLLLLGGLLGAGLLLRWAGLGAFVAAAGQKGPWAFIGAGALACGLGVPRQVVAYTGGLAFGFWTGSGLALAAQTVGCCGDFALARLVGRGWVARRVAEGGRAAQVEAFLSRNTFLATLTLRLLPVGNNMLTNLIAGASSIPAGAFIAGSVLGYGPQTVVFALLGGGLRVTEGTQIAVAGGLLALSLLLGAVLLRRSKLEWDDFE